MLRAWRHRWRLRNSQAGRVWLLRITQSLPRSSARAQHKVSQAQALPIGQPGREPPAEQRVVMSEELCRVRRMMQKLPPLCRDVLYLHAFEQLDHDEIAEVLRTTRRTVAASLFKARQQMREMLPPKLEPPHRKFGALKTMTMNEHQDEALDRLLESAAAAQRFEPPPEGLAERIAARISARQRRWRAGLAVAAVMAVAATAGLFLSVSPKSERRAPMAAAMPSKVEQAQTPTPSAPVVHVQVLGDMIGVPVDSPTPASQSCGCTPWCTGRRRPRGRS